MFMFMGVVFRMNFANFSRCFPKTLEKLGGNSSSKGVRTDSEGTSNVYRTTDIGERIAVSVKLLAASYYSLKPSKHYTPMNVFIKSMAGSSDLTV